LRRIIEEHAHPCVKADIRQLVNVFVGIFEKHKLLFSFQICVKLEQDAGRVSQEEVDFFIKVKPKSVL